MNRNLLSILALSMIIFISGCSQTPSLTFKYKKSKEIQKLLAETKPAIYPKTKFIVFSDPHVFDPSLGTQGEAFKAYIAEDRKLLAESTEILDTAIGNMSKVKADFVMVCGDLTKDGEKVNHERIASSLAKLKASGKKVFVVPGNHDLINPNAVEFKGDKTSPVNHISPEDFVSIYGEYGFNSAIYRDTNSLSYIAEPVPGLWLLCLDSTDSKDNIKDNYPQTDGAFSQATIDWIETMLTKALVEGKAVFAMEHHGMIEHWNGQEKLHGEYLVDNYRAIGRMLATYNVRAIFTGHYHAQDITVKKFENGKSLYDIETGSLITYPCPYRVIAIDSNQQMDIKSFVIDSIASNPDFKAYAAKFIYDGMYGIIKGKVLKYNVPDAEASKMAPVITKAFVKHYQGDEPVHTEKLEIKGLGFMGNLVLNNQAYVIKGLWQDLAPSDNNLVIDLSIK